ncbi:protein ABHD15 [Nothobranchius furzeri]|uniref:Abhydrolase domain containing 15 n=1 Tax=Nothobranchius furzeri TaxID=105023 RepID=A0A8C6KZE9_NOTFU|nr:protein ABHD15-like [Nothobranchius furzeri]
MASFVWDCLFCLLPCFCLLLLSLCHRRPRVRCWTRLTVRAAAWRLWVIICLILELPLHRNTRAWCKEVKPPEADIKSGQTSDGPRLICKHTALARYLLQRCGSLTKSKLATWPRGDPHIQTVSSQLWGQDGDHIQFTRDHLLLKDGGIVALDWAVGTRLSEVVMKRKLDGRKALGCFTSTPPVLLLIPQLWGGMTPHLKLLCHQAMQQGFYVVVFHHRGSAGSPLTTTRLAEFGDPADLEEAVLYVHSRHPSSALVAVSEGSGSGVLLSYLGERGSSSHLTAAAAISPVLLGQLWFQTPMLPLYRWATLFHRKMQLSRYESSFRGVLDVDRALSCSSLRYFEEALFCSPDKLQQETSPGVSSNSGSSSLRGLTPAVAWMLGERAYPVTNWESYWERNEPLRDADEVEVPVLCICSKDDPLLPPASTLPISLFLSNPYFLLLLTDRGGHCGFSQEGSEQMHDGRTINEDDGGIWSHAVVLEYFKVVADFLKEGERDGVSWRSPVEITGQTGPRNRMNATASSRRRRGTMTRKPKVQVPEQNRVDEEERRNFTWRRSYTR